LVRRHGFRRGVASGRTGREARGRRYVESDEFDETALRRPTGGCRPYQTLAVYRPASKTTVIVLTNTDIAYKGQDTSTVIGQAITSVLTPKHVLLSCGESPASCKR
jgi:hypothetical protein